ncbi:MAG: MATE family efflux transporter [Clostridiales Family XIII bacterium]|nr:MATE family efflux transporter [Clostridiales Family XIII bacterium]
MKENKMGAMPVGKLLANMSMPPMISMLAAALYNVIDSFFVAKVSEDALAAVTLVFPIQMMMIAVNVGIGVGLASLISRRLGQKRQEEANLAATHGFVFAIATWVVYAVVGIFLAAPFIRLFTGSEPANEGIFEMAVAYCRIVMTGSLMYNITIVVERILQSTGNTLHPMIFNLIGIASNTVIAPILIIGWFPFAGDLGFPGYGVVGAGYAAIIGQAVGTAVALILFCSRKHAVHVSFRKFRIRAEILKDILTVGLPSMVMQAVQPILLFFLNALFMVVADSALAVAVLGVYFRISTFTILPVVGLNQGALPIMGYNFGAKNRLRLMAAYTNAFRVAVIIMAVGMGIFWIFPHYIMMWFTSNPEMIDMGVHAFRAVTISWLPGAFVIITIGLFQALAHGVFALIISIVRQLGFILPLAYILLLNFGVNGAWYAYPLAEIAALTLTIVFFFRVKKQDIDRLPDGDPVSGRLPEPV